MATPKRVLVADDDPDIRALLTTILRQRNLLVDEAANGDQALEQLEQNPYAVVLLDLMMPGVDGFGVLDALRASADPPVVLVVTAANRAAIERLDTQHIHGIIRKPFEPDEVAELVVACVEIKSRGTFEAMALSVMIASAPIVAWLTLKS
ncbi:MAG TPA: response regulator [Thermoanaerobaculia bacterium]|nr:response regulator [Thermoanaerobaculia bacterium]